MFNRYLFLLLAFSFIISLEAQIGINTTTPNTNSILHIRSNNSTPGNYENDLIIDAKTGNIGLGTENPSVKMDVNGNFRFSDKSATDFSNNILTTDSIGNASWKDYNKSIRYQKLNWNLKNSSYPDITNSNNIITLSNTTSFSTTIEGASHTDNSITLPKGRYYITISAGLSNATSQYIYQIIRVMQDNIPLIESYYFNTTTSSALFLELQDSETLSIQIEVPDLRSDPSKQLPIADAFPLVGPNNIWARVNILTLNIAD